MRWGRARRCRHGDSSISWRFLWWAPHLGGWVARHRRRHHCWCDCRGSWGPHRRWHWCLSCCHHCRRSGKGQRRCTGLLLLLPLGWELLPEISCQVSSQLSLQAAQPSLLLFIAQLSLRHSLWTLPLLHQLPPRRRCWGGQGGHGLPLRRSICAILLPLPLLLLILLPLLSLPLLVLLLLPQLPQDAA